MRVTSTGQEQIECGLREAHEAVLRTTYRPEDIRLAPNTEYVVYAMTINQGTLWVYIDDGLGSRYPVWYPNSVFGLTDGRLSRWWVLGVDDDRRRGGAIVVAFPEWARTPYEFYDRLTDGAVEELGIWARRKRALDLEFAPAELRDKLIDVGCADIAQCPRCRGTVSITPPDELARCEECGLLARL